MPAPSPCTSAHNLTESWRRDHDGMHLRGGGSNTIVGWACDFRKDLQWFRFTGSAGRFQIARNDQLKEQKSFHRYVNARRSFPNYKLLTRLFR